jgi:hypothetical protein
MHVAAAVNGAIAYRPPNVMPNRLPDGSRAMSVMMKRMVPMVVTAPVMTSTFASAPALSCTYMSGAAMLIRVARRSDHTGAVVSPRVRPGRLRRATVSRIRIEGATGTRPPCGAGTTRGRCPHACDSLRLRASRGHHLHRWELHISKGHRWREQHRTFASGTLISAG